MAYHYIAGMIEHAPALAAITCPVHARAVRADGAEFGIEVDGFRGYILTPDDLGHVANR